MNKPTFIIAALMTLISANVISDSGSANKVYDENSLRSAIEAANYDSSIKKIVFRSNSEIKLTAPIIYSGVQSLKLIGKNTVIDGSAAGSFILDPDLTAITEDGTLVFNTASDVSIKDLTIKDSATRGIVVNVPKEAVGDDISIRLTGVNIVNSALYGLHIDDNADEFDEGNIGSEIGIDLEIRDSSFIANGTGAIDFDGVRVDERSGGDIVTVIIDSHIDSNGGDGIELDEAGDGGVDLMMVDSTINQNGGFNQEDLDDGLDIDEADGGDVSVSLHGVDVNNNQDEGFDVDEEGQGNVQLDFNSINVIGNIDEGIKIDEEDEGNIRAKIRNAIIDANGDEGMQFTEVDEGKIKASFKKLNVTNNAKAGIRLDQFFVEDEEVTVEEAGSLKAKKVILNGNGKNDEIRVTNIEIK